MMAYGTHKLASARRSGLSRVTVSVCGSTILNWSGLVSDPVLICGGASDLARTVRSSDHLTSSAVTGLPSCHTASGRSAMVMVFLSSLMA